MSGPGYALAPDPCTVADAVDAAAADLDALLAADVVAMGAYPRGPEPWECDVARAIGTPVVTVRSLLAMPKAG